MSRAASRHEPVPSFSSLIWLLAIGGLGLASAVVVAMADDKQAAAALVVAGDVDTPLNLSLDALAGLPRKSVQTLDHEGQPARYEGVPLAVLLEKAGAPVQERLRGDATACYVVVSAADGYRAVFSLAELDPWFTDKVVLLADRCEGKPIAGEEGPLRLVVPDDNRHGRWVRMVRSISVKQLAKPEGPAAKNP